MKTQQQQTAESKPRYYQLLDEYNARGRTGMHPAQQVKLEAAKAAGISPAKADQIVQEMADGDDYE